MWLGVRWSAQCEAMAGVSLRVAESPRCDVDGGHEDGCIGTGRSFTAQTAVAAATHEAMPFGELKQCNS